MFSRCHSGLVPPVIPDVSHAVIPDVSHAVIPDVSHAVTPDVFHAVIPDVINRESKARVRGRKDEETGVRDGT